MLKTIFRFIRDNSLLLLMGATAGLIWANVDQGSYYGFLHAKILANDLVGSPQPSGGRAIDLHYLVNDILMALFFALAGKEVWESLLPGGSLNNLRNAATPLLAAIGGMVGPATIYLVGAAFSGQYDTLSGGWAIPCATDIAFSYLVARIVFGSGHPGIPFLLLLAIADDAIGLVILAIFYPQGDMQLLWLGLTIVAVGIGFIMHQSGVHHFVWYMIGPGVISWFGFALAGLHPALGLLPIIPTLPHLHSDSDRFSWAELNVLDTLNHFEHTLKRPVDVVLGLFGLLNAGVVFGAAGMPTTIVLAGLLVGKPLGIWLTGMFAGRILGMGLPQGINGKSLFVIGCTASIGFTVALFVATVAFPDGSVQDAAKMGALASFSGAFITVIAARLLNIERVETSQTEASSTSESIHCQAQSRQ